MLVKEIGNASMSNIVDLIFLMFALACRVEKETGPAHERKFVCSVQIELPEAVLFVTGVEKSRVKDAENSAASVMLHGLVDSKYI